MTLQVSQHSRGLLQDSHALIFVFIKEEGFPRQVAERSRFEEGTKSEDLLYPSAWWLAIISVLVVSIYSQLQNDLQDVHSVILLVWATVAQG